MKNTHRKYKDEAMGIMEGIFRGTNTTKSKFAILAFLAILMIAGIGMPGDAGAAITSYAIDQNNGTTIATGITTNVTSCGNQTISVVTTMNNSAVGNCAYRVEGSDNLYLAFFNTAYSTSTTVTGQASGNPFYLRERDSAAGTITLELVWTDSAGNITSLGSSVFNIAAGQNVDHDYDLSGITGVVPAGGKLGVRITGDAGHTYRVYVGPGNLNGGGDAGYITVDEVAAPSGDTLTASGNTNLTTANPDEGTTGYDMQRFQVACSADDDNNCYLSSLTLQNNGTADSLTAYVYIDSTSAASLPGTATLLGQTSGWTGGSTVIGTFTDAARQITNGTPKYVYIVYDIPSGQGGNTIQSDVTALTVDSPDSVSGGNVGQNTQRTVQACSDGTPSTITIPVSQTFAGDPYDVSGGYNTTGNVSSFEYKVTTGSGGGAPFEQMDSDWGSGNHVQLSTVGSNWTDTAGLSWCVQQGGTPSTGPGPTVGNPDPYIYHEASAASGTDVCQNGFTLGDTTMIESNLVDAGAYILTFDFDYNFTLNGSVDSCLHVDVWNGLSWDLSVAGAATDSNDGNSAAIWCGQQAAWTNASIDLDALGYNSGNIRVRMRQVTGITGTVWHYDYAYDNLHISGPARSVETICTDWTSNASIPASVTPCDPYVVTPDNYNLFVRGTDPDCGGQIIEATTFPQTFTWSSLAAPSVVSGPTLSATDSGTHVDNPFHINAVFNENGATLSSCEYTINGGSNWYGATVSGSGASTNCDFNAACTDTQSLTMQMRATNSQGTTTSGSIARTCDTTAPSTSDDVTVGWRNTDQSVTLTPTDGGSGVASTVYCVDTSDTCSPATPYAAPFNVICSAGTVCTQYVRYASTDNVGNIETTQSSTSQIDKTLPSTGDNVPVGWQASSATVTLTPTDTGSGVASTLYCVDTSNTCSPSTSYTLPFNVPCSPGTVCTQYVRYASTDNAGNVEATKSSTSQIDKTLPSTTDNVTAGWRSTNQTVTLSPTDTGSGVASTLYCVDSVNSCTPVTSGVSVNVTCTAGTACTQYVRYASTDNVGNVEGVKSSTSQIDKSTPSDGSLTPTPGDTQIDLSWSGFSDTGSGLDPTDSYKLVFNQGGTFPNANCSNGTEIGAVTTQTNYNHSGLTNGLTYYYRICGIDAVGNVSAGATASGVPNAGPQPPSVVSGATPSATDSGTHVDSPFHVNAVFDDNGDAISGCEYCVATDGICDTEWVAATASGTGATTNCDADPTCSDTQALTINMRATNINGTTTASAASRTCDTAPPVTSDDVSGWRNTDQSVTLTPADTGSGAASTVYCVDTADTCSLATAYAGPFNVTCLAGTVCTQYVRYASTDNVGNVETTVSSTSLIDKVLPVDGVALSAVPLDNEIRLTWDAGSDADSGLAAANRYKVVVATGVTPPADCSGAAEYQGNNLGYNDITGVVNGTAYSYRVCVFDEAGNVSSGQTITETPAAPPPSTITSCSSCHAMPPTDATGGRGIPATAVVGSHSVTEHLGLTCTNCHIDNGTEVSAYPQGLRHREGLIEVLATIHGQAGSSYSKGTSFDQTDIPTLGTCNTTFCHGTVSFVWGTDKASSDSCTICHGNEATLTADGVAAAYKRAPGADGTGVDTAGNTGTVTSNVSNDAQVGAHQVHLNSQNSYGKNVPCNECHTVPTTPSDAGHYDSALPADMTWGTLATTGLLTPNWIGGSCTNTYCHGNAMPKGSTGGVNKSPAWSTDPTYLTGTPALAVDCAKCHEAPPLGLPPHTAGQTIADCATCHTHFNINGSLNNIALHIDGAIQANMNCWDCHGDGVSKAYPPDAYYGTTKSTADGVGAHVAHIETTGIIFTKEGVGTTVDNWCNECHAVPLDTATHTAGPYPGDVDFTAGPAIEASYGAVTPAFTPEVDAGPDVGVGGSCSVYCHGVSLVADGLNTTPAWGDTITGCTACHGNPSASVPDHTGAGVCTGCHDHVGTGVNHIDGSVTYPNATCTSCHAQPPSGLSAPNTDGSHQAHWTQTVEGGTPVVCTTCHVVPATMDHANGVTAQSCSTATCHNKGLANATNPNPTWGTGTADCTWCHGNPPTSASGYNHANPQGLACNGCHSHNGSGSPATHINGATDVAAIACDKCHGNDASGQTYPPSGGHGALSGVGAHVEHMENTTGIMNPMSYATAGVICEDCHTVPATWNAAGHLDGSAPGTVAFNDTTTPRPQSTEDEGATQAKNPAIFNDTTASYGATCSVYCHGINMPRSDTSGTNRTPAWGDTISGCTACHGAPPSTPAGAHDGVTLLTQCSGCHPDTVTAGGAINDPTFHINGAIEGGGECITCHDTGGAGVGGANNRRAIVPEFALAWSHKADAAGVVTNEDCIVCHMEGVAGTTGTSGVHNNGVIDLRDPDTGLTIKAVTFSGGTGSDPGSYTSTGSDQTFVRFSRNLGSSTIEAAVAATQINHCLKCHDSVGAASADARVTGGTALRPFNTTPNHTPGNNVLDVNSHFATTNSSYHPVRGKQNNTYTDNDKMFAPWNSINKTEGGALTQWGDLISCWDCHAPDGATGAQTVSVTAHGGAQTLRGTSYVTGTPSSGNAQTLCIICHAGYSTQTNPTHGLSGVSATGDLDRNEKTPYMRWGCFKCHGSADVPVRPTRSADVHGFDGTWGGYRQTAFIRNTDALNYHRPKSIGGTDYTEGECDGMNGVGCGGSIRTKVYTPGGVY